jgi:hypothetical protein
MEHSNDVYHSVKLAAKRENKYKSTNEELATRNRVLIRTVFGLKPELPKKNVEQLFSRSTFGRVGFNPHGKKNQIIFHSG